MSKNSKYSVVLLLDDQTLIQENYVDLNHYFRSFVVGRGFEPLWTGWKPGILTLRWTDQISNIICY